MLRIKRATQILILSALIVGLVCGCSVSSEDYENAKTACEPHGGLDSYRVCPMTDDFICKNGMKINFVPGREAN